MSDLVERLRSSTIDVDTCKEAAKEIVSLRKSNEILIAKLNKEITANYQIAQRLDVMDIRMAKLGEMVKTLRMMGSN